MPLVSATGMVNAHAKATTASSICGIVSATALATLSGNAALQVDPKEKPRNVAVVDSALNWSMIGEEVEFALEDQRLPVGTVVGVSEPEDSIAFRTDDGDLYVVRRSLIVFARIRNFEKKAAIL